MTEPKQHRNARQDGEQESEEARSGAAAHAPSGEEPASQAGKASTAFPEGVIGRATDTIEDDEGHYLEPPD